MVTEVAGGPRVAAKKNKKVQLTTLAPLLLPKFTSPPSHHDELPRSAWADAKPAGGAVEALGNRGTRGPFAANLSKLCSPAASPEASLQKGHEAGVDDACLDGAERN